MPKPEEVNPHNFHVDQIIYNDGDFSIVWGEWEDGNMHLAMRWNGSDNDAGYPKTFGHPVWFLIPAGLSIPILRGVLGIGSSDTKAILAAISTIYGSR
jgi:hypothetical protein